MAKFVTATLLAINDDTGSEDRLSVDVNVEQIAMVYPSEAGGSLIVFAGTAAQEESEYEFAEPVAHFGGNL
jgi:hypothetical protein